MWILGIFLVLAMKLIVFNDIQLWSAQNAISKCSWKDMMNYRNYVQ